MKFILLSFFCLKLEQCYFKSLLIENLDRSKHLYSDSEKLVIFRDPVRSNRIFELAIKIHQRRCRFYISKIGRAFRCITLLYRQYVSLYGTTNNTVI